MNCKPGDLAWVVKSVICHENLWRIVQVVRPSTSMPGAWACAGRDLIGIDKKTCKKRPCQHMAFADWQLRPLRPDPELEREMAETVKGELA